MPQNPKKGSQIVLGCSPMKKGKYKANIFYIREAKSGRNQTSKLLSEQMICFMEKAGNCSAENTEKNDLKKFRMKPFITWLSAGGNQELNRVEGGVAMATRRESKLDGSSDVFIFQKDQDGKASVEISPEACDDEEIEIDQLCRVSCFGKPMVCEKRYLTWSMVFTLVILTAIATITISIDYGVSHKDDRHIVAWYSAGIFVILSVSLSLYEIFMHLANFSNPPLQRYIVRILWMVPIYAVESWFSLRFKTQAIYLESARETYEGYVIYNSSISSSRTSGGRTNSSGNEPEKEHHIWPMQYFLKQWRTGKQFVVRCKLGTLQYVVIKIFITITTFILEATNKYDEGNLSPNSSYLYIALIGNFSQIWAMYCLVLVYHAYYDELEGLRPLPKFICVKAVVFFSFWQQVLIAVLVQQGVAMAGAGYVITGAGQAVSVVHKRVQRPMVGYEDAMPEGSYEVVNIMGADGRKQSILVTKEEAETIDGGNEKESTLDGKTQASPPSAAAAAASERIHSNEQLETKSATAAARGDSVGETIGEGADAASPASGGDAERLRSPDAGEQSPSEDDIGFAERKSLLPSKQPAE
eukprot:jgi/Bigna1/87017/estExt_fgenesh1_pg.C_160034